MGSPAIECRRLRVGINARLLYSPSARGWNRYTANLLAGLVEHEVDLVLYADRPVHRVYLDRLPADRVAVHLGEGIRLPIWEHRWLPRRCELDRLDVLHSPYNAGLPWSTPCPRVLTLHDAISTIYDRRNAGWRETMTFGALRSRLDHWVARTRADRIITVSEHAKGDLIAALGIPSRKVTVVPEAADPLFHRPVTTDDRARARDHHRLPDRYLFYVGGWEERKNIPFLVRAFAEARPEGVALLLAGGRADQRLELEAFARDLGIDDRVRLLEWVEDDDLPALYAGALAFVYPSAYEGFGLQICEALAVGCPTLAARATSLPEVLGGGGATFALDDPAELVGLLRRVAGDPTFRDELSGRARRRSSDFSWRRTAEQTLVIYRELIGGRVARPEPSTGVPG